MIEHCRHSDRFIIFVNKKGRLVNHWIKVVDLGKGKEYHNSIFTKPV